MLWVIGGSAQQGWTSTSTTPELTQSSPGTTAVYWSTLPTKRWLRSQSWSVKMATFQRRSLIKPTGCQVRSWMLSLMLPILHTSHVLPDFPFAVFSSVTMSLLAVNQGNIWVYEESVLIRGRSSGNVSSVKTFCFTDTYYIYSPQIIATINICFIYYLSCFLIDTLSWPVVQFPKCLLNLTDSSDMTEVRAYLSVLQLLEDSFQNTPGIMESTSGTCVSLNEPVVTLTAHLLRCIYLKYLFPDVLCTLCCHLVCKWRLFKTLTENKFKCKCNFTMNVLIPYLSFTYCITLFSKDTWVWICIQWQLPTCGCTRVTQSCMWLDLYRSVSEFLNLLDFRLPASFQPGSLT